MLLNSRQFADKCGVAPQTILDWVNRGILIPVKKEGTHFYFDDSQVVDVFKMKVKQYSRMSFLCLFCTEDEKEVYEQTKELFKVFKQVRKKDPICVKKVANPDVEGGVEEVVIEPMLINSIDRLLETMLEYIDKEVNLSSTPKDVVNFKYNKLLLKEFQLRYENAAISAMHSLYSGRKNIYGEDAEAQDKAAEDGKILRSLPYEIMDKIFFFETLTEDEVELYNKSGVSISIESITKCMHNKALTLAVNKLGMRPKEDIGKYVRLTKSNPKFKELLGFESLQNTEEAKKQYEKLRNMENKARMFSYMHNCLTSGYMMPYNLTTNPDMEKLLEFSKLLNEGYFSTIICDKALEELPENVQLILLPLQASNKIKFEKLAVSDSVDISEADIEDAVEE